MPHAQVGIEDQHAVFDRIQNDLPLAQVLVLDLHGGVAKYPERLGHLADLVAAGLRQRGAELAAGDRQHAVAERRQPADQAPSDVAPDDQRRAQKAERHHADQHENARPLRCANVGLGQPDVRPRTIDEPIDRGGEPLRRLLVGRHQRLALRDQCKLLFAQTAGMLSGPSDESAELLDGRTHQIERLRSL